MDTMTYPSLKYHLDRLDTRPCYPDPAWFAARKAEAEASPVVQPHKFGPKPSRATQFLRQRKIDHETERDTMAAWLDKHGPKLGPAKWHICTTLDIVDAMPRSVAQHIIRGRLVQYVAQWLRRTGRALIRAGHITSGGIWTRRRMAYGEAVALYRHKFNRSGRVLTRMRLKAIAEASNKRQYIASPNNGHAIKQTQNLTPACNGSKPLALTLEEKYLVALLQRDAVIWKQHYADHVNAGISPETAHPPKPHA